MLTHARAVVPEALGVARLRVAEGGWALVEHEGEVDALAALDALREGEAPLFEPAASDGAGNDEVEAVLRSGELQVVVANVRQAVVLRLPADSNIGLALAFARQHVRAAP